MRRSVRLDVGWKKSGSILSVAHITVHTQPNTAAASLGQVYKGKLRATGEAVAVKVQRPFVLETVSLDLYLLRNLGLQLRKLPFLKDRTDLVALLDEFAGRFYDELDYEQECRNG